MKIIYALAALLPLGVYAECPGSCSGNGLCMENDQCTCHAGYRGNDCSRRMCPHGKAWMASPRGDLNYNGDRYQAAQYHVGSAFTTRDYVITDENQGGAWELWPSDAVTGEGHHVMECSNAGLCDMETGTCVCFDGFEGSACQRQTCPGGNHCNGHGTCQTIAEQIADTGSANTYDLWDADMMRTCRCDPGYTGVGCMDRECPVGSDPMTTTHQIDETQYVEIWSTDIGKAAATGALGGTFTLTYKDSFGQEFETAPISVQRMDGTAAATKVATDTATALKNLPNGHVPDVSVTAGYCEKPLKGQFTDNWAAHGSNPAGTVPADNNFMRCPNALVGATVCAHAINKQVATATPELWAIGAVGCGSVDDATIDFASNDQSGCTIIKYPRCIRLAIRFTHGANTGDLNLLTVNHDSVTLNGITNAASNDASGIASSVSDVLLLSDATDAPSHGFVKASDVVLTTTAGDSSVIAKVVTFGTHTGNKWVIPKGATVNIQCKESGGSAYRNMGDYEVDATTDTNAAATMNLVSAVNDPASRCAVGSSQIVTLKSDYISSNVDYTQTAIKTGETGLKLGSTQILSTIKTIVPFDTTTGMQYFLLTETPGTQATITHAAMTLSFDGAGTKEADECSGRGNCDTSTGLCSCHKGYTGERCDTQNALWVGQ